MGVATIAQPGADASCEKESEQLPLHASAELREKQGLRGALPPGGGSADVVFPLRC